VTGPLQGRSASATEPRASASGPEPRALASGPTAESYRPTQLSPRPRRFPSMDIHAGGPLAYFITFHSYGTWLPGDRRGSVDAHHNAPGTPYVGGYASRLGSCARRLEQAPVILCDAERSVVVRTIQEVCTHRGWVLRAVHVRTNHVHVVVRADFPPER